MSQSVLVCPVCREPVPPRQSRPIGRVPRYTCAACGEVTLHSELLHERRLSVGTGLLVGLPPSPVILRPHVPTWGSVTMLASGPYNQRVTSLGPIMDIPFPVSVIQSFRYGVDCVLTDPGGEMSGINCEVGSAGLSFSESTLGSSVPFPTTRAVHYTTPTAGTGTLFTATSINGRKDMIVVLRSMQFGLQDVSLTVYDAWLEVTFSP